MKIQHYFNFQVRGAPAIAIVGCLSLGVELTNKTFHKLSDLEELVVERLNYLVTARPTAVNMADAAARFIDFMETLVVEASLDPEEAKNRLTAFFCFLHFDC